MIVHIKNIIKKAQKGRYAVGAFNTANLEVTLAIARAASAMNSPVIIQVSESTIKYAGLKTIYHLINSVVEEEAKNIPIAIHLDHGRDYKIVKACVDIGFSSVHMDASEFDFNKNVSLTAKAVKYAHSHGAWCQGELGSLYGKEGMTGVEVPSDPDVYMTDPDKVDEFVARTNLDTLAVSVGTLHGLFEGKEKIDFKRLSQIENNTDRALVLHGASGVKNDALKKAVGSGVRIVNIDTELRIAFTKTLMQSIKQVKSSYDPRKILEPSIEATQKIVEQKIKVLGSYNQK